MILSRSSARNWSHSVRITTASAPFEAAIGPLDQLNAWQHLLRLVHAFGVEGADGGARRLQGGDDVEGRGVAHVVGVGLEGQAQHRDGLAFHLAAHGAITLPAIAFLRAALTSTTVSTMRTGEPASLAVLVSASVSLGKHEPP